nr:MAG TPA: hypothetical protein [Caudoviricetes sp.]
MAKGPHKAGQLPRTVTKPFGFLPGTTPARKDQCRPEPHTDRL